MGPKGGCGGKEWRRWDLNPQPRDYDALALPLSYLARRVGYYYGGAFLSTPSLRRAFIMNLEVKSLYKEQEYFKRNGHEGHKRKTFGFYSFGPAQKVAFQQDTRT